MTPQLTEELCQALAKQPGIPLEVEDPRTHNRYVVVQLDLYEQLRRAMDYDASEPDPRAFYPAFAEAVKDDLDAMQESPHREAMLRLQEAHEAAWQKAQKELFAQHGLLKPCCS
jgi:hypothetical protein